MKKLYYFNILTCIIFNICSITTTFSLPTREELLHEIAILREMPQMQRNFNNLARNLMDEIAEQKMLDQTTSRLDYLKKYLTFWFSALFVKDMPMILITPENAPLLSSLVDETIEKMGITEKPLVYLAVDPELYNAFASGFFKSMSVIVIGEKMLKEMPDIEAIKFTIAHETAHIKNRDCIKHLIFSLILSKLIVQLINHYGPRATIEKHLNTIQTMNYFLYSTTFALIWGLYSRARERRADKDAAYAIGALSGIRGYQVDAARWEPRVDNDYQELKKAVSASPLNNNWLYNIRVAFSYRLSKVFHYISLWLATHPPATERIAYLEKIAQEQEQAAANC